MIRIVHISDIHMGKNDQTNEAAGKLLGGIRDAYPFGPTEPNYLLVTGDIVDDGARDQYRLAQTALAGFAGRLLVAPGNHDYAWEGTFFYNPGAAEYFDNVFMPAVGVQGRFIDHKPVVRVLRDGKNTNVLTIGLNSVRLDAAPLTISVGKVGAAQLELLNTYLTMEEFKKMQKVVYLHHRPERCEGPLLWLEDKEALLNVVRGKADFLCYGHDGIDESPSRSSHSVTISVGTDLTRPMMLNANGSVGQMAWFDMVFDGTSSTVRKVSLV